MGKGTGFSLSSLVFPLLRIGLTCVWGGGGRPLRFPLFQRALFLGYCPDITRWTALHYCSLHWTGHLCRVDPALHPIWPMCILVQVGWRGGSLHTCQVCPTHTSQHHREAPDEGKAVYCVKHLRQWPRCLCGWTKGSVPGLNRLRSPIRLLVYRTLLYLHETSASLVPVTDDPQGRLLPTYPMPCYAMPSHPGRTAYIASPARVCHGG